MVDNEEYINLLKGMVSCVNHGDYYSIKELSNLELEKMQEKEKGIRNEIKNIKIKKEILECKQKPLEEWDKRALTVLIKSYSDYIVGKTEKFKDIKEFKREIITINEFIDKI